MKSTRIHAKIQEAIKTSAHPFGQSQYRGQRPTLGRQIQPGFSPGKPAEWIHHWSPRHKNEMSNHWMHFGTAEASQQRRRYGGNKDFGHDRTVSIRNPLKNPIRLEDMGADEPNISLIPQLLKHEGIKPESKELLQSHMDQHETRSTKIEGRQEAYPGHNAARQKRNNLHTQGRVEKILQAHGHDGIVYRNTTEDFGKDSHILFDPMKHLPRQHQPDYRSGHTDNIHSMRDEYKNISKAFGQGDIHADDFHTGTGALQKRAGEHWGPQIHGGNILPDGIPSMDAEIEADRKGKPQRWESKELHNNMKSTRIHERLQEGWMELMQSDLPLTAAAYGGSIYAAGSRIADRIEDKLAKRKAFKDATKKPKRSKRTPEFLANRQEQSDLERFRQIQNEKTPLSDYNP